MSVPPMAESALPMDAENQEIKTPARGPSVWKRVWSVVQWLLFAVILVYVGKQAWGLISDLKSHPVQFRPAWFAAAVVVSTLAWLPSMWYWRSLMGNLGCYPSWWLVARAYFGGHLAKYAPGKVLVIAIRVEMIRGESVRPSVAAYTVAYESLAYMGAGAVAAAMLVPWIVDANRLPGWASAIALPAWKVAIPIFALVASALALGQLSNLISRLAKKRLPPNLTTSGPPPRLSKRLCIFGMGPLLVAWWMHGLVLGLVIQSFSSEPFSLSNWPLWTAANAVAMVGGFLAVFAPGGLGVREALFIDMLEPQLGHDPAILAALLMRLACLVSELVSISSLYLLVRAPRQSSPEQP